MEEEGPGCAQWQNVWRVLRLVTRLFHNVDLREMRLEREVASPHGLMDSETH